jgi:ankyrin repeat protein
MAVANAWGNGAMLRTADLCREAIIAGADVNDMGACDDGPPLVVAASRGLNAVVKVLLAHGAAPDLVGSRHSNALQEAISGGHVDICRMVLAAGADPNLLDYYGDTPLMRAAEMGRLEIMTLLAEHGARVNAYSATTKRFTALHYAVSGGDEDSCRRLLELGADPMSCSHDAPAGGLSPFLFAAKRGGNNLLRLMFDTGRVDPFAAVPCGATAASIAASFQTTQELVRDLEREFLANKTEREVDGVLTDPGASVDGKARRPAVSMVVL